MNINSLKKLYKLNKGMDITLLEEINNKCKFNIPLPYLEFLQISNGLYTGDELVLLEIEDIEARNDDYEVQVYLPGL
ncbi:hypothetical protein TUM4438_43770 [Shewanella sairae]|uniref:SMI1/KNR4 family protein n=1 Tax=Shewanella sairae TaxID=190310 RepID=A0ABQ4PRB7_9GAMM|nr:hypothetical protein [Shewanella sairae]MCL1132475.1 hypothetical protein [Shewanella sairae]GIU52064.1 hypothetical protein TUM4438_43770 [Shewanella sairae]